MLARALIHLYPCTWRERYGPEMTDLLAAQRLSLRTVVDLVAGAIDARVAPQRTGMEALSLSEGARHMMKRTVCNPAGLSARDQWRSAGWMVGGSFVLAVIGIILKQQIGPNSFSEALLYSAVPASLMLSSECSYLKRYSSAARMTMSLGGAAIVVGIMWAAVEIGYRI